MTVAKYYAKFMELSRYAPHIVSPKSSKAGKFKTGLRWNIRNKVYVLRLATHKEVVQRAIITKRAVGRGQEEIQTEDKVQSGKVSNLLVGIHRPHEETLGIKEVVGPIKYQLAQIVRRNIMAGVI